MTRVEVDGNTAVVPAVADGMGREVAMGLESSGAWVIGHDGAPLAIPDAAVEWPSSPIDVVWNIAGLPQTKHGIDVLKVHFLASTITMDGGYGAAVTTGYFDWAVSC